MDDAILRPGWGADSGLDFDPLVANDYMGRYRIGTVLREGKDYWVEVRCLMPGIVSGKVLLYAEVRRIHGRYRFEDFRYPRANMDLLSMLREWHEAVWSPKKNGYMRKIITPTIDRSLVNIPLYHGSLTGPRFLTTLNL